MKRLSVMVCLGIVFGALSAVAADDGTGMRKGSYGLAGCGLGSMVFEKNTKVHQVFAATTNGTFGTQTFGISSGTSNCTGGGVAKIEREQELFVEANLNTLTEEMAQGKGETLFAFAGILGCRDASAFGKFTQANYGVLSKTSDLLATVKSEIASDARLSTTCGI